MRDWNALNFDPIAKKVEEGLKRSEMEQRIGTGDASEAGGGGDGRSAGSRLDRGAGSGVADENVAEVVQIDASRGHYERR